MTIAPDGPEEEWFEGHSLGVEKEDEGEIDFSNEDGPKPWDPEKIRVTTKTFSLRHILDMIDSGDLDLAPDFQRKFVWKAKQKSRLIESLFLQIPMPAFYFSEDTDGLLRVVDGLQRLTTIHSYARSLNFLLRDLEYLSGQEGLRFDKLPAVLQRRLLNAQIVANVIDPSTPTEVKYDIFARINTGGAPLNSMEIRHCMSKDRSRSFLKRCIDSIEFRKTTSDALYDHVRMQDREAVLRFCAFRLLVDLSAYEKFGSLERLLSWATEQLDDPSRVSDNKLDQLFEDFERAMINARIIFGDHAFRKWPLGTSRLSPINRPLLESWSAVLADHSPSEIQPAAKDIASSARKKMTTDYSYLESITTSTSHPGRVRTRFIVARNTVEEAINAKKA
ncbi:DUF262 domain-containing protein [Paenarthrobacter nitroguajacolicus]|uniref:DUF262 domain-containing protein n=1 Tax=Paenarthrobacter nitroguajacolicus TaxID=211146 RepID=UPI003AE4B1DC